MRTSLWLLVFVLLLPVSSLAQETTPAGEIAGGYAFLRDNDIEENLHGWFATGAGNINRWFSVVGEASGSYKTYTVLDTDIDLAAHTFMGGPRFSARRPKVTPFGQFLVGVWRGTVSVLGESESQSELALQPGGGIDVWLSRTVALRAGADYRYIFFEDEGSDEFRLYVGLAVALGER